MAEKACWAEVLGGCRGKVNREHYFTRSIFTGARVTVDGAPWLGGGSKTIGLDAAVAHILCEGHNSQLGERADVTGKELRQAIADSVRAREATIGGTQRWIERPSGLVVPRPELTLSGRAYGEWLCKTHCDVMAVSGKEPDRNYVEYAFGITPARRPWIYYPHVVGEDVQFTDNPHVTYVNFEEPGEPFGIQVCGLWAVVALEPLLGDTFLDRVAEIRFKTLILRFDWTEDPPLPRTA
jgi:hypothetical protein